MVCYKLILKKKNQEYNTNELRVHKLGFTNIIKLAIGKCAVHDA
jgi:hypothetical protein